MIDLDSLATCQTREQCINDLRSRLLQARMEVERHRDHSRYCEMCAEPQQGNTFLTDEYRAEKLAEAASCRALGASALAIARAAIAELLALGEEDVA